MRAGRDVLPRPGTAPQPTIVPDVGGRGPCAGRTLSMPELTEREIIRRAFALWQKAGCPEGKDRELCRQAVQELRNEQKHNPNADA